MPRFDFSTDFPHNILHLHSNSETRAAQNWLVALQGLNKSSKKRRPNWVGLPAGDFPQCAWSSTGWRCGGARPPPDVASNRNLFCPLETPNFEQFRAKNIAEPQTWSTFRGKDSWKLCDAMGDGIAWPVDLTKNAQSFKIGHANIQELHLCPKKHLQETACSQRPIGSQIYGEVFSKKTLRDAACSQRIGKPQSLRRLSFLRWGNVWSLFETQLTPSD
jgi:hypothetical protein